MSEYSAIPSTGKLKLKGVKESRVDKKKKKKKPQPDIDNNSSNSNNKSNNTSEPQDDPTMSQLADEDAQLTKEARRKMGVVDGKDVLPGSGVDDGDVRDHLKTEAERRYDEQRRRRLEERLKREGVKTHKERVEELNRYLSTLSEHHDMPKIGPG